MAKDTLLLHACCAPCATSVYERLSQQYDVSVYFYNPNISPLAEYKNRLNEIVRLSQINGFTLHIGEYDIRRWTSLVSKYRTLGEGSERCRMCFSIRLEQTFALAASLGIENTSTTLSVSPHKDADMINSVGRGLAEKNGINFIEGNFKKNAGFARSVELSKEYGFYRQDYCGCVYSRLERKKDFSWVRKFVSGNVG